MASNQLSKVNKADRRELEHSELLALLEIARMVGESLDLKLILDSVLDKVLEFMGADIGAVLLIDEAHQRLVFHTTRGMTPEYWEKVGYVSLGEGIAGAIALTGEPAIINDITKVVPRSSPRLVQLSHIEGGQQSFAGVPLKAKNKVLGLLTVLSKEKNFFAAHTAKFLASVGSQIGMAIENAQLHAEQKRLLERTQAVWRITQAISANLDLKKVFDAVLTEVRSVLPSLGGHIALYDRGTQTYEIVHAQAIDEAGLQFVGRRVPVDQCSVGEVLRTKQSLNIKDFRQSAFDWERRFANEAGRWSFLVVPLLSGDEFLGAIGLSRGTVNAFSDEEEAFLNSIAPAVAVAIKNARLYQESQKAYEDLKHSQEQMVKTEKQRALGSMASGIAHDFNNLLAAILGHTQLLMRAIQDPKLRRRLDIIERATMDGAAAVRRIQEFTRTQAEARIEPVDANEVIAQVLDITRNRWQAEAALQGLNFQIEKELKLVPRVHANAGQLREAILNLVLNALDAMPQGGRLSLRTSRVGGRVAIEVADTGIGMSEETKRKIFDPFFTTKGPNTSGLGLTVSDAIVSRYGGKISVESEEGRGSKFTIELPISPEAQTLIEHEGQTPPRSAKILVIDDEADVREVIAEMLTQSNHTDVTAAGGREGLEKFESGGFDLVITDLGMPGMSGQEVAKRVKVMNEQIPVLLITGWGAQLDRFADRKLFDFVITKPLTFQSLMSVVRQALETGSHTGPSLSPPSSSNSSPNAS